MATRVAVRGLGRQGPRIALCAAAPRSTRLLGPIVSRPAAGLLRRRFSAAAAAPPPQPEEEPAAVADDPFKLVQNELSALTGNIEGLLKSDSPVLEAAATYFFQGQQGKHFRPSVVLLMAQATAAHTQQPIVANESQQRLAEISEMIHTASLLHDDVIDESDERRGKASGQAAFGNKVAVLAGDFLLARASMALARLRDTEVVEVVSLVIEELVEGELLQIRVGSGSKLGREEGLSQQELFQLYLRKNYLKTGSLIGTCPHSRADRQKKPSLSWQSDAPDQRLHLPPVLWYLTPACLRVDGWASLTTHHSNSNAANSCRASAMLGQQSPAVCDAAYDYGRHLGTFQTHFRASKNLSRRILPRDAKDSNGIFSV
jgi:geranylgeranyl pyrophosphate synthase